MSLATASGLASFDMADGEMLDMSDVLAAMLLSDCAFLGRIGLGGQAIETTHKWMEDALNATTIIGAEEMDASEVDLTISADQGNKLRVGALIKDTAAGKTEVMQVTAISTVTLTVTRGYGSTTGETHADAAVYRIISQPVQENHTTTADRSKARTQVYNYTQIFKNEVELSNTMLAVKQAGVVNELAHQITNRTLELKRELGMTVYHGIRSSSAGSDTVYRTMAGIREYVYNFGSTAPNYVETAVSLDENVMNALAKLVWDNGGEARLCVGAADQITKFASINSDLVRLAPSDRVRGVYVQKFLTNLGVEIDLLVDRWFPTDEILLCDESRVKLLTLRPWSMTPLAITGDGRSAMLVAEMTMEVRNGTTAHAVHTNLTV